MRVMDMKEEDVHVGLRLKGLKTGKLGTIVSNDKERDNTFWVQWDGDPEPYSAFYGNACECEVIEKENNNGSQDE